MSPVGVNLEGLVVAASLYVHLRLIRFPLNVETGCYATLSTYKFWSSVWVAANASILTVSLITVLRRYTYATTPSNKRRVSGLYKSSTAKSPGRPYL